MITKLKIDISAGLLEVEGAEDFVKTIYEDFKGSLAKTPNQSPGTDEGKEKESPAPKKKAKRAPSSSSTQNKSKAKKAP